MKRLYLPLICAAVVFSGCSTYKNSQTPDDVYYSPGQGSQVGSSTSNENDDYYSTANDQYVRMRVQDPDRWSYFDDYNYDYYGGYSPLGYSPYYAGGLGYGMAPWVGFGYWSPFSYWNSYYSWNSFYNPYYGGVVVVNPKVGYSTNYSRLATFNPASYSNKLYNRGNARSANFTPYSYSQTIRNNYNSSNNASSRSIFNRPMNNNSTRTYSPSSSSFGGSRSSGGGGGGGASRSGGVGRPGR